MGQFRKKRRKPLHQLMVLCTRNITTSISDKVNELEALLKTLMTMIQIPLQCMMIDTSTQMMLVTSTGNLREDQQLSTQKPLDIIHIN